MGISGGACGGDGREAQVSRTAPPVYGFEAELLLEPRQLREVATAWDELGRTTPSPHLTSAWLSAWWETSGIPAQCLVLRDGDRRLRAGVLFHRSRAGGLRGAADVYSGDWGVVASDLSARNAAWRFLARLTGPVGRMMLPSLDPEALEAARAALMPIGYRFAEVGRLDSPALSLPGSYEALVAGVSKNLRSQQSRARRTLERDGHVQLRTTTAGEALKADLEAFLRLEASGWKGKAGSALLCDARSATLYRRFVARGAVSGIVRLHLLELDGRPIAADLACRVAGRTALIKTAYDERLADRSPGLVLRTEALRVAINEGSDEYDFLGAPDWYKMRWGAQPRPRRTVLALRGPWRVEATARERVRPPLGRLKRRVLG